MSQKIVKLLDRNGIKVKSEDSVRYYYKTPLGISRHIDCTIVLKGGFAHLIVGIFKLKILYLEEVPESIEVIGFNATYRKFIKRILSYLNLSKK